MVLIQLSNSKFSEKVTFQHWVLSICTTFSRWRRLKHQSCFETCRQIGKSCYQDVKVFKTSGSNESYCIWPVVRTEEYEQYERFIGLQMFPTGDRHCPNFKCKVCNSNLLEGNYCTRMTKSSSEHGSITLYTVLRGLNTHWESIR
ncbi:hypothetical protein MKW98_005888 [Papaver atlanticum]|uniref:Uncharacterized protein n=1 Tax=Papaver atlanticum TaxID=357466 RepID=A0AAD4TDS2_9MAGN|nr:hypothetical protein MKW98_005888 [Papaver atlanticum]